MAVGLAERVRDTKELPIMFSYAPVHGCAPELTLDLMKSSCAVSKKTPGWVNFVGARASRDTPALRGEKLVGEQWLNETSC